MENKNTTITTNYEISADTDNINIRHVYEIKRGKLQDNWITCFLKSFNKDSDAIWFLVSFIMVLFYFPFIIVVTVINDLNPPFWLIISIPLVIIVICSLIDGVGGTLNQKIPSVKKENSTISWKLLPKTNQYKDKTKVIEYYLKNLPLKNRIEVLEKATIFNNLSEKLSELQEEKKRLQKAYSILSERFNSVSSPEFKYFANIQNKKHQDIDAQISVIQEKKSYIEGFFESLDQEASSMDFDEFDSIIKV